MAELLIELFSQEIPARMQARAAQDLERLFLDYLTKAGYLPEATKSFVTARRLTLVVDGLPETQPDRREERKGPKVGAPEKAIDGFLGSVGLTLDQVEIQSGKKGDFYVAVIEEKGKLTAEVIADILPAVVQDFPWPKSQRWGRKRMRWVRPLQSIVCLFDGEVVDLEVEGIKSGNQTFGHRFLAPEAITVSCFEDYAEKLERAHVMLDREQRKEVILHDAKQIAFAEGVTLNEDETLLEEVAGLVEWPVVLMGKIDETFLEVPREALMSSMAAHQKYFSVNEKDGDALAARFIVVSNMVTADGGTQIVDGNERVLRARLSDAKFFWDKDLKTPLEDRTAKLEHMVFHARLGTVAAKAVRNQVLAEKIAELIGGDPAMAARAALLAKTDLMTDMVGEFPDLQGVMGRYYAQLQGEPQPVADAIRDHYAPQGPGDACPTDKTSVAVAMADKLDTLTGFWAIDEKPTGSKDPFALRRAALGIIRLILENSLRVNLLDLFKWAAERQSIDGDKGRRTVDYGEVADLLGFFADRLKVHLREQGTRHDLIDAVFGLGGQDDLVLIIARVEALAAFVQSEKGADLLSLYTRAMSILSKEEKKDKTSYSGKADAALFEQDEERSLFADIQDVTASVEAHVAKEDFAGAMAALARLHGPVNAFFDEVTVNADTPEIRKNRLTLLSQIRSSLHSVADFSKIEG